MGIWQHTHTVNTTELSPDLGELAEIIDDVSVEIVRPTKVGNAGYGGNDQTDPKLNLHLGLGNRQNHKTP